jgi:hypothetical protein
LGLAAAAPAVDLATIDGRRYQEAEVTWFYADAVIVRYEGVKYARLPLIRLRPESLVALGFPPPAEEEPAEGMEEGLDAMEIPAAPARSLPRATPRLRPLGAASNTPAPRSNTTRTRFPPETPPEIEVEVETEDAPKPKARMVPRQQGMTKPKRQKKAEQAPLPPENPFDKLLEEVLEDNETQRLQDRKLEGEAEKLEIRPFPGDNL